ncbi:hypothetical protein [Micromonospora sp. CA-248212]|uniref:hypothetical protein n=1 Tax=Micromonospora sp. CA-248212 TaxID=3239961 RepID=UPI003D8DFC54
MDDFDRLADDMDGGGDKLGRDAHDMVHWATKRTGLLGRAGAPVRTGRLKSSITEDFDGGSGANTITGETGPDVRYDAWVHNGTSRQAPNPFMDRAANAVEPEFYARAELIVGRVLDG